jgi:MerR family transcriptional regulator, heat shock protein HspR
MTVRRYDIIFFRPENQRLTLEALAERAGFHPAVVQAFIDCGLIEPSAREGARVFFDEDVVSRLRMIGRLRENLGINLAGIAVILNLRDRLSALQRENAIYRARI